MKGKLAFALLISTQILCFANGKDAYTLNEDNSVTINFKSPGSDEVKVNGAFGITGFIGKPVIMTDKMTIHDMRESGDGWWSFTSMPLESDLYWYNMYVDGADAPVIDKQNPDQVRDISTWYNYFIVPGEVGNDFMDRKTDNGTLDYVWYPSTLNGMTKRRMGVYLPYGYSENSSKLYPVLYLLHGSGGDETSWVDLGRLVQVMDNMIADGRCEPMIVVVPNGGVHLAAAPGFDPENPDVKPTSDYTASKNGDIENAFVPEIVNFVDSHYRTIADKKHRAIAGLSLGGFHTLYTVLNNPDTFDYVGLFSALTENNSDSKVIDEKNEHEKKTGHPEIYRDLDAKLERFYNGNPELLYIAIGRDDFLKKMNDDLRKKLHDKEYPFHYNESAGGHTWTNWRHYLRDFLPKLKF